MANNNDQVDPMVKFKGCKRGVNKSGNEYISLNLTPEETAVLVEAAADKANNRGLQIIVHFSEKTSERGSKFESAIAFVRGIPEPRSEGGYGDNQRRDTRGSSAPQRQQEPAKPAGPSAAERLANLRKGRT